MDCLVGECSPFYNSDVPKEMFLVTIYSKASQVLITLLKYDTSHSIPLSN